MAPPVPQPVMGVRLRAVLLVALAAATAAASSLEESMREVERIRKLAFDSQVSHVSIDRSELTQRLTQQIEKSLPYSTSEYEVILRALQLVDSEHTDLTGTLLDLYEAQVLAFYDPLTRTYYSINQPPEATKDLPFAEMMGESVVIHELMHALQDQRFAIGRRDRVLRNDWDAQLAYHALLEGEATLVMLAWLLEQGGQSIDDIVQNPSIVGMLSSAAMQQTPMGIEAPRYFIESLKFPYLEGLKFVIEAYRRGGWDELDRIHADPPRTAREILDPEAYFKRQSQSAPGRISAPAAIRGHQLATEHLGVFHWSFLLGMDAAKGWRDDRVEVVQDSSCQPTVLVASEWETPDHARAFRDAYVRFLRERGVDAHTDLDGNRVRVAYGADDAAIYGFME